MLKNTAAEWEQGDVFFLLADKRGGQGNTMETYTGFSMRKPTLIKPLIRAVTGTNQSWQRGTMFMRN